MRRPPTRVSPQRAPLSVRRPSRAQQQARPRQDRTLHCRLFREHVAASAPPSQLARVAAAPVAVASAGPETGVQAATPFGVGDAVQITSQRSEAEAKASFQELRAKFPNQLGGRQPIIRRADLGAKGTYYRALVGPFASSEQAAALCSGLKAAGGSCIVQRN